MRILLDQVEAALLTGAAEPSLVFTYEPVDPWDNEKRVKLNSVTASRISYTLVCVHWGGGKLETQWKRKQTQHGQR